MKQALISPLEPRETGYRVAEVAIQSFEVAPPYFWVTCTDTVTPETHYYSETLKALMRIPPSSVGNSQTQPTTTGAQTL